MPAQPQRGEALIELVRNGAFPSAGVTMEGEEMVEMVMEVLAEAAHPEYVTLMVDQSGHPNEYRGVEGFREGDAVYSYSEDMKKGGFYAEYAAVKADHVAPVASPQTTRPGAQPSAESSVLSRGSRAISALL